MRKLFMMLAVIAAMAATGAQAADDAAAAKEKAASEGQFKTLPDVALTNDPAQRAQFVLNMFFAGCFVNFFNPDRIAPWADKYMNRLTAEDAASFLTAVTAKTGDVWFAQLPGGKRPESNDVVPGGEFVLVTEPGRCHVIGLGTDEAAFHTAMKKFSDDAKKNMAGREISYEYRAKSKAKNGKPAVPNNISAVKIRQPKNGLVVTVFGSSTKGGLHEVTSIITMFSNARLPEAGEKPAAPAAP
ncbi:MAG: hypothetical protein IT560_10080 [Alphaproteobacteria bacterium]|nr:hypothetical protein [Alphaproteobacteria bacterium]